MADDTTQVVVALVEGILILIMMGGTAGLVRRFHFRKHVWMELRLRKGEKWLHLVKPEDDGSLETKYGRYVPSPNVPFEMFTGGWWNGGKKQIFTFYQGDPRPIRYTQAFVFAKPSHNTAEGQTRPAAANGGTPELMKVSVAGHQVIPAETLSVFMKQKLFADVYQKRGWEFMVLVGGLVIIALLLIFLLSK